MEKGQSVSEIHTWPSTVNGSYLKGQAPKVRSTPIQLNGNRSLWERIFFSFLCLFQSLHSAWLFVTQWTLAQLSRLLCPWDSPGKFIGVDSHSLLQGIFPTVWSNSGLQRCRQILYYLSHQRNPEKGLGESSRVYISMVVPVYRQYVLVLKTGLGMSSGPEMVTFYWADLPHPSTQPFLVTSDYMYQAVSLLVPPLLLLPIGCFIKYLHSSLRSRLWATFLTWQPVAIIATPRLLAIKCWHLVHLLLPEKYSMTTFSTSISGPQRRAILNMVTHTFSPTCSWWVWWWCVLWLFQETKSSFSLYKVCPVQHAHLPESFNFFL